MSRRTREQTLPLLEEGRRLINERGMSETKAAQEVGVSQGTMSRFMREERKSKKKKVYKKKLIRASKEPTITPIHIPMKTSGGKTLLIISEDADLIAKLIERYYV